MSDKPGQKSGWDKTLEKRQRDEVERRAEAERGELGHKYLEEFDALGDPPKQDPTAALPYAQDHLLVVLHQVSTDRFLTAEARWRFILEACKALGMTHSKTHLQARMQKIQKEIFGEKTNPHGPESLDGIAKPAKRARRGSNPGPSKVSGSVPAIPSEEEQEDPFKLGGSMGSPDEDMGE